LNVTKRSPVQLFPPRASSFLVIVQSRDNFDYGWGKAALPASPVIPAPDGILTTAG